MGTAPRPPAARRCRSPPRTAYRSIEVSRQTLEQIFAEGKAEGIETRGASDDRVIDSISILDPHGYVIELCIRRDGHDEAMNPATNGARAKLRRWTASRRDAASA
jgi:hypothetical protein